MRWKPLDRLNRGEIKIGDYMLEGDGASVDAVKAGAVDSSDFGEGKTAFYFSPLGNGTDVVKSRPERERRNFFLLFHSRNSPAGTL